MDYNRDLNNTRNNRMYYNQMRRHSEKQKQKPKTFGDQDVKPSEIVFVVEGFEAYFYIFYFFTIPYVVGVLFLYLAIAGGDYNSLVSLDLTSFFIVWAIGYEIVATISLIWIFVLYLKYDDGMDY